MRLIDADAFVKKVVEYSHQSTKTIGMALDATPTVDAVERKRGRWIPIVKGERGYSAGDFRCSVCGDPCKCYSLTNFCPNCGAEMAEK